MEDIKKDIEESIEKNLPKQVGDILRKRLEKANKDEIDLVNCKIANEASSKIIDRLEKTIEDYKKLDERNIGLEKREIELIEKERNLKIKELEYKLINEKEKTEFTKNIALGLVRNIEYRKTIFDSENQSGYYKGNEYIVPSPINKYLDETNKIE